MAEGQTRGLLDALRRHYIRPSASMPGGVFVEEVGCNGRRGGGRRCDAIYVGFTATSGRLMVGHEVKTSRADWLHELASPGKADWWADQCHQWWVVAVPGIVQQDELPEGWGLMEPGRGGKLRIVRQAATLDLTPSWDAVRSIIARQDTLQDQEIHRRADAAKAAYAQAISGAVDKEVERQLAMRSDDHQLVEKLKAALGVRHLTDTNRGPSQNVATISELAQAWQALRATGDITAAGRALTQEWRIDDLRSLVGDAEALIAALETLRSKERPPKDE